MEKFDLATLSYYLDLAQEVAQEKVTTICKPTLAPSVRKVCHMWALAMTERKAYRDTAKRDMMSLLRNALIEVRDNEAQVDIEGRVIHLRAAGTKINFWDVGGTAQVLCDGPTILGPGWECQRCGATSDPHRMVCAKCKGYGYPFDGCPDCGKRI